MYACAILQENDQDNNEWLESYQLLDSFKG